MSGIELTAYSGAILGPIAKFLGWIMNGIYMAMYKLFGIENIGLSIFLLTVLIYTCLLPLTYKQQKFSKLNQKMQPEMNAIREKYAGKRDQASVNAMNEETQLLYQKYGVSPAGSCVQLIIQMPILFALYRVFYNVPAYVTSVKEQFSGVVNGIIGTNGFADTLSQIISDYKVTTTSNVTADLLNESTGSTLKNYIVDVLYKLPSTGWDNLTSYFPDLSEQISDTIGHMEKFNYIFRFGGFDGLNISDTPFSIIKNYWSTKPSLFMVYIIAALLIPVLSYLSQLLTIKLMPTADTGNDQMAQQMKTMNMLMPLFSFVICFTVPCGLGIYWIFSAVYRCVQQVVLNRHFDKVGIDELIQKNQEKAKKKREKRGITENQIREAAQIKAKNLESRAKVSTSFAEKELEKANAAKSNAKVGSMAYKANLVKEFNESNSRK